MRKKKMKKGEDGGRRPKGLAQPPPNGEYQEMKLQESLAGFGSDKEPTEEEPKRERNQRPNHTKQSKKM